MASNNLSSRRQSFQHNYNRGFNPVATSIDAEGSLQQEVDDDLRLLSPIQTYAHGQSFSSPISAQTQLAATPQPQPRAHRNFLPHNMVNMALTDTNSRVSTTQYRQLVPSNHGSFEMTMGFAGTAMDGFDSFENDPTL